MSNHYLFISNYKSYLSYEQSLQWLEHYGNSLITFSKELQNQKIILCPSFDALPAFTDFFKNSDISIGAQNCSPFNAGPYTGEVTAQSLQQLGCTYGFVGHNERRIYFHETDEEIAQKIQQLITHQIIPIFCIGETKDQYEKKQTKHILQAQLNVLVPLFKEKNTHLCIAYEPQWLIGTNLSPDNSYLSEIFEFLNQWGKDTIPSASCTLLYGGNVQESNSAVLKQIPTIQGLLIGRASLDFQKFKKIVLS